MAHQAFQYSLVFKGLCRLSCLFVFFLDATIASAQTQSNLRIISLAPSVTEIIFALGAGEQLVGVTRFCDYPEKAIDLPKVGGFSDLNLEAIVSLKPNLVLGMPEHGYLKKNLSSFNIEVLTSRQSSLADIFTSIKLYGEKLSRVESANLLIQEMQKRISRINNRTPTQTRPSVLVTVGGHIRGNSLDAVYAAGKSTLYNELIELAGGRNVLDTDIKYAKLSAEALLTLNPEIILDLAPAENQYNKKESDTSNNKQKRKEILATWSSLPKLKAVEAGRVHILNQEYVVNPGPRVVKTLELFVEAIHPRGDINASD